MTAFVAASRADTAHLTGPTFDAQRIALLDALRVQHDQIAELQHAIDELAGHIDGDSIVEREIAERSRIVALERVSDVEDALNRIDEGTYGRCEQCGQIIAAARLEVIPYARCCVDCHAPAPRLIG